MENLVRAITDYLRSLTNDHENINAPSDFLQFLLETLMEDLFQLSADMDVEVAVAMLNSLQDIARQLHILSETEEWRIGRPSCLCGTQLETAQLFRVCESSGS